MFFSTILLWCVFTTNIKKKKRKYIVAAMRASSSIIAFMWYRFICIRVCTIATAAAAVVTDVVHRIFSLLGCWVNISCSRIAGVTDKFMLYCAEWIIFFLFFGFLVYFVVRYMRVFVTIYWVCIIVCAIQILFFLYINCSTRSLSLSLVWVFI